MKPKSRSALFFKPIVIDCAEGMVAKHLYDPAFGITPTRALGDHALQFVLKRGQAR